ncbi:MAG: MBL fold metallo-hydrolase, partial [Bacteroidota bacterium]
RSYYFGAAHTNGDAIIHFEHTNIAHMGDLLFNRMHPFIDRSAGASISNWIQVLQKARNTFDKDTQFIFGHAADPEKITGGKEDLAAFEAYLQKLLDFVSAEIKAGKSKEEVIKNKDVPGLNWKAPGAERSLTAAYDELTSK